MADKAKYYRLARNPKGFWGKRVIKAMNSEQHAAMPQWALAQIQVNEDARVLDVGCGGGANIARLLELCPKGTVTGLDISPLAIKIASKYNAAAIAAERCSFVGGNVVQLPIPRETFHLVTAFENNYYWLSQLLGLQNIYRVLKPGGTCVIANEMDGTSEKDRELEKAAGRMLIFTIDEIKDAMAEVGFTDITSNHDEERHFIIVVGRKP